MLQFLHAAEGDSGQEKLFQYLPNGTSLKEVKIPSYSKTNIPESLIIAEELELIDKKKGTLQGDVVTVKTFDAEGILQLTLKMKKCFYQFKEKYLDVNKDILITGDKLLIQGTGAHYDLQQKKLFIKGPIDSMFFTPKTTSLIRTAIVGAVCSLSAPAQPTPPTKEKLAQIESQKVVDSTTQLQKQSEVLQTQASKNEKSQKLESSMNQFLKKSGNEQLVSTEEGEAAPEERVIPQDALQVTSENGMYFDYESGHLVYLKNVRVKESRFTMRCDDQLKVFLEKKAEAKAGKDDEAALDVSELIATGNVVFRGKDPKGKVVIAKAQSVHYDVVKEEILLEGGLPSVQQGQTVFEALEPGVWMKISRKGVITSPGKKTRTIFVTEEQ